MAVVTGSCAAFAADREIAPELLARAAAAACVLIDRRFRVDKSGRGKAGRPSGGGTGRSSGGSGSPDSAVTRPFDAVGGVGASAGADNTIAVVTSHIAMGGKTQRPALLQNNKGTPSC